MSFAVRPFNETDLDEAAPLLAARHRGDRAVFPQLPKSYEDPAEARAAIEHVWRHPGTTGSVALDGDAVVGYLLGSVRVDTHMGRTVWVRPAGYAVASWVEADVIRDLYAAAGAHWVDTGCFDHCVMTSAGDQSMLQAWYSLGFGQQQAHALLTLSDTEFGSATDGSEFGIRRVTADDGDRLAELASVTGVAWANKT